jgi:UDP-N-acetylglucosamine 2-epimerase (non-hydrolysing)
MKNIYIIVGTRPNFIKVTQFKKAAQDFENLNVAIVHTGQHYDEKMASVFFDQFNLRPDIFLNISPGHPGLQIASMIEALTNLFLERNPDLVVIVGDVNSTLAAGIAANKCEIPVAHLESGLRSFDKSMPEEHNRIVADDLAQLHFVTEDSGLENLRSEKKGEQGIAFVGNTMIDTLVEFDPNISKSDIESKLNIENKRYALVTIHRPSNVDTEEGLNLLMEILADLTAHLEVVFPIHPRTLKNIGHLKMEKELRAMKKLHLIDPLGYFDFQKLVKGCLFVLTDSGGIQEETTFLQKPCLTLRPNTERPVTIDLGTNELLPFNRNEVLEKVRSILNGEFKKGKIPRLWDGKSTHRVLKRIDEYFNQGF